MSRDPLLTYLRDHLAGAVAALELLDYLKDQAADGEIRAAAHTFYKEIGEDRETLQEIANQLGGSSSAVKDATAWLGEKLSRLKLGAVGSALDGLPLFEAVESLSLGITGKIALWDSLIALAQRDTSLPAVDYYGLRKRAQQQHERMELHRLRLATMVLTANPPTAPRPLSIPHLAVST